MNTEMTVEVIRAQVNFLMDTAERLSLEADYMEKDGDLSYVGNCLNIIANIMPNLRIDLLATRPIREYQREVIKESKGWDHEIS